MFIKITNSENETQIINTRAIISIRQRSQEELPIRLRVHDDSKSRITLSNGEVIYCMESLEELGYLMGREIMLEPGLMATKSAW